MMFAFELDDASPATLQTFMTNHPTADADGDGAVTKVERDAYLVARAMARPDDVLAEYPSADRDSDGVLTATEAARLVNSRHVDSAKRKRDGHEPRRHGLAGRHLADRR